MHQVEDLVVSLEQLGWLLWAGSFHVPCVQPEKKKKEKILWEVPILAQQVKNSTSIHEDAGSIPVLAQWFKDLALLQAVV